MDGVVPQGAGVVSSVFQIRLASDLPCSPQVRSNARVRQPPRFPVAGFVGDEPNHLVEVALASLHKCCADKTQWLYNPLVISGGSGTGKSLLLACFADFWRSQNAASPEQLVVMTTGPDWARDFAKAIRNDAVDHWRHQNERAAAFCCDDLHLLEKKSAAQDEFMRLIDSLNRRQTPMLFAAPSHPTLLHSLNSRLTSRLAAGLCLELQNPGPDARREITRQISQRQSRPLHDDAIEWFAKSYDGTVFTLQNILFGAYGYADDPSDSVPQDTDPISRAELKRMIANWNQQQNVSLRRVAQIVARYTQIPQKQIYSKSRCHPVVQARGIAMYLARTVGGYSLRAIGKHFGGRDHSTVVHACDKIHTAIRHDSLTRQTVEEIERIIRSDY